LEAFIPLLQMELRWPMILQQEGMGGWGGDFWASMVVVEERRPFPMRRQLGAGEGEGGAGAGDAGNEIDGDRNLSKK
jgi:hypothetical protein